MRAILLTAVFLVTFSVCFSQSHKPYRTGAYELIFSYGYMADTAEKQINSEPRFSGFFNQQQQIHFYLGKHTGFYTGLGVRNVGIVTQPAKGIRIKQRAYGLGVPLALKLGNIEEDRYFSIGGEAEYFFNYKEKIFINKNKHKNIEWFTDKVTPFNPSVFLSWQDANGVFIRAKYYLYDFLKPQNSFALNDSASIPGYSKSSMFFSVSIGINIRAKDEDKPSDLTKNKPSAYYFKD